MSRSVNKSPGSGVRYDEEFKEAAVQQLLSGKTLTAVSKQLGVSVPTLISWKKRFRAAEPEKQVSRATLQTGSGDEISRLRFELAKVVEERDRLRRSIAVLIGATSS